LVLFQGEGLTHKEIFRKPEDLPRLFLTKSKGKGFRLSRVTLSKPFFISMKGGSDVKGKEKKKLNEEKSGCGDCIQKVLQC